MRRIGDGGLAIRSWRCGGSWRDGADCGGRCHRSQGDMTDVGGRRGRSGGSQGAKRWLAEVGATPQGGDVTDRREAAAQWGVQFFAQGFAFIFLYIDKAFPEDKYE